jgi:hypothetical protein
VTDLEVQASGNDLIIGVRDPSNPTATFEQLTDKITIQNWTNPLNQVQNFQFADGTTLSASQMVSLIDSSGSDTLTSSGGIDTLAGSNSDQIVLAVQGATGQIISTPSGDTLSATGSGNVLTGGTQTDTLTTAANGNTLAASTGAITMIDSGTQGIYQYGVGDGAATIVGFGFQWSGIKRTGFRSRNY